jgi:hypothetical protein
VQIIRNSHHKVYTVNLSKTLKHNFFARKRNFLFLLGILFCSFSAFSQGKTEDDLKKQAAQAFEDEDYATGFRLYSTLVANYPKDPSHNYRLGVCMLYSDPNKKKCMQYLKFAVDHVKETEKEVFFYYGKAYHLNFQFDDAIKYYNLYKESGASSSMQKKLSVDHEIQCCKNGKRLLANVRELVILDKKELSLSDYFRSYDLKDIGGKLLAKPADFITPVDKKKKDKSIIYLPASKEVLYYASYGTGDNKDIYIVRRLPSGDWSKPENLITPINTEYDEDFPFLHPNGKVLYFASKGHNSMGGYDIFKSELDEASNTWKEPVNLDFPINSPDDDVLFVTDSLEKIAFLASARQSPIGKIDVYKILTERRPAEFAFIKGTVIKKNPAQSVLSKIKVKNIDNGEDAGTFTADENGVYTIKIPNGGKYIFTVETPGFPTQSEGVTIPTAYNYKPYKQVIEYSEQKLQITNFFETNDEDENNYVQYLKLIEEKSKMNVNAGDFDINPANPLANTSPQKNPETVTTTTTSVITPTNTNPKTNVTNSELVKMANDDAKELQQSADSLKKDAAVAFSAANSKQDQANEKKQEAQDLQNKANSETDPAKKQELTAQAEKAKDEADLYTNQATTANSIAKQMEVDATNKQKEADLNAQYAKALEEADKTKNNKQAIAKLEDLQKQLEEASKQKSGTNNLVESIKADAQNKEQELQNAEAKQKKLDDIIGEFNKQLDDLNKQEKETNDKDLLENIRAQKEEILNDLNEKQKESDLNKSKIAVLKDEADALKSQAEYASNVLSGTPNNPVSVATNITVATNTVTAENNPSQTSGFEAEAKKYDNELATVNSGGGNDLDNNKKKEVILGQYLTATNKELKDKKEELKKAKTSAEKTTLNNEIKQLTEKKNELDKENKAVAVQIKEQEKAAAVATNTTTVNTNTTTAVETNTTTTAVETNTTTTAVETNTTSPVETNTTSVAANTPIENNGTENDPKLKSLNDLLNEAANGYAEEKKVFNELTYTNPKAAQLKKQADDAFNNLQKNNTQLEQQLEALKGQLTSNSGNDSKIREKNRKADELSAQSIQLRKDAKTMSGSDKQNALNKILSLEKEAADLRYHAAKEQYESGSNLFASNKSSIIKIEQQTKKQSPELQQAKTIVSQSENIKADAVQIHGQSEKETSQDARFNTLVSANQKQTEAIGKQDEALALLKKANPNAEVAPKAGDVEKQMTDIKAKLAKEKQTDNSALKLLIDANKAEYAAAVNAYYAEEKKLGSNFEAGEIRAKAENMDKDANLDITKIATIKEEDQKRELYIRANGKLEEAISLMRKATQTLSVESSVATDTVTPVNTNTVEPVNTNTVEPVNTNTTVTTNTVEPVTTNTVEPVNTNTVEPINTNTTVAANTNTVAAAGTLTETQVEQIKNTPEFQKVASLKNNINKYSDAANNDTEKSQEESMKAAKLTEEVAALPDGPEKQNKIQQAEVAKQRADSLQEMANNTRALANSKKEELDEYNKSLDKTTSDNIAAASLQTTIGTPNTNTPNAETSEKYKDYSPGFGASATQMDKQLELLHTETSTPENLNKQNTILTTYIGNIDKEVAAKKKQQQEATTPEEKNKIAKEIKTLQLQKIVLNNERSTNESIIKFANGNNAVVNNPPNNNRPPENNTNTPAVSAEKYLNTEGFEVKKGNAYSAKNPIPVDEKLPDGLYFRVQIGAFKNPIPQDRFSGLAPVGAENTSFGFVRYQVGMFSKYQAAVAVKNDLRKLKYNDAFVVAYLNGKRISLADALDTLRRAGQDIIPNANSSAGITVNSNIPVNPEATVSTVTPVTTSGDLNQMSDAFYTIQIGVYGNNVSASGLRNLTPVFKESLPSGYNRYTAGIYNDLEKALADKARVNALGIPDAFVGGYVNGKRLTFNIALDNSANNLKFATERPIIFPTGGNTTNTQPETTNTQPANPNVQPFTNGVTEGPTPTANNGVKTTDEGITFKVQIGAFRNQVPKEIADNWLKVKTWPIKYSLVNDLYLYTVGSFTEASFAKNLKAEIVALGITDAFVTVFKDGKKLYGADAAQYLNR